MAGHVPSFLGSPGYTDKTASVYSGSEFVRNHLQEVEDDDVNEDKIEDSPLSPQD